MNSSIKYTQRGRLFNLSIAVALTAMTLLVTMWGLQVGSTAYALSVNTLALAPQDERPTVVATVTVGSGLIGVGVKPTPHRVYVANPKSNNVSVSQHDVAGDPQLALTGQTTGAINTAYAYTATTRPVTATTPIAFAWQATEQTPVTQTSGLTDAGTFTWTTTGTKTVTATARNVSSMTATHHTPTVLALFEDSGITLAGVWQGSAAWGDYDADGDLDVLLTSGTGPTTKIYRNDGNGVFTDINATLEGVNGGSVAWGDYDNDGDLDILLAGLDPYNIPIAKVYRNDGNGVFTDINAALTGVWNFLVMDWGDYDNDGDLDIFLAGSDRSYNDIARIYRNDGGGIFIDIHAAVLQGISVASMAWGDYDNDSDLDILLTGWMSGTLISKVYRNDGGGTFADINAALQSVNQSSVAWGDYDNDGDLDILLAGWAGSLFEVTKIYRNDGGGVFTDIHAALTNVTRGPSTAWGDYDNDGDLDVLLRGCVAWDNNMGACSLSTTKIYRNDGGGVFTDINAGLPNDWEGPVIWGDYDNDGDLDILIAGAITRIYRNNTITANTVPSIPTSLAASVMDTFVTLSWNAAHDVQTPAAGLTYNLRIGTAPGGTQIVSPMATGNGFRQVPQLGNASHGLTATLKNLSPGTYYWNVQAIDSTFSGSPFASESSFTVEAPIPPTDVTITGSTAGTINTAYIFTATVNPDTATTPITYVWQSPGQLVVQHIGGLSDTVSWSWATTGAHAITLTATNAGGTTSHTHTISLAALPDSGDAYEPDDACVLARPVSTDGAVQEHTFQQQADHDWVTFSATDGITYFIVVQIPLASPADVMLELYNQCNGLPQTSQDYTFSPGVRLEFRPQTSGPIYLKLLNHSPANYGSQVAYNLSVRAVDTTSNLGAVVIVAGRLTANDPLQANIHNTSNSVYQLFATHGYTSSRIYYLATDPNLPGFDALATADHLQAAITSWALDKVGPNQPFTLYLADHGAYDRIYLDKLSNEWVTPQQIDQWLTQLETAKPGVKVNVFAEACYSGSFIDLPQRVGKPGRVVIASTGAANLAWASPTGAIFSDQLVAALNQGDSLYSGFQSARWAVQAAQPFQTPWLDDNGNGIPNEPSDGQEAQQRGFNFAGTLADDNWPPYITQASGPSSISQGHGIIRANVADDQLVQHVWAVVYPPAYQPPTASDVIVSEPLPTITLLNQGNGWYAATYVGFTEMGLYRVVVYAEDNTGTPARPVLVEVRTGWMTLLPIMIKQ